MIDIATYFYRAPGYDNCATTETNVVTARRPRYMPLGTRDLTAGVDFAGYFNDDGRWIGSTAPIGFLSSGSAPVYTDLSIGAVTFTPTVIPIDDLYITEINGVIFTYGYDASLSYPDTADWYGVNVAVQMYRATVCNPWRITSAAPELNRVEYSRNGREYTFNVRITVDQLQPRIVPGSATLGNPGGTLSYDAAVTPATLHIEAAGSASTVSSFTPLITGNGARSHIYNATFTHTFATRSGGPLRLRVVDTLGRSSVWHRVPFKPVGAIDFSYPNGTTVPPTVTEVNSGDEFTLDSAPSFDPDGDIVETVWEALFASERDPDTGEPLYDAAADDFFGIDSTAIRTWLYLTEAGDYRIRLMLRDNDGFSNAYYVPQPSGYPPARYPTLMFRVVGGPFGSFVDGTAGVLYTAVNEDTGVRVSRFLNGAASRELLARIDDAHSPSIYQDSTRTIHLGLRRSDDVYVTLKSTDDGRTFN